ncbi:MAG: stage II sporulation protein D [Bacilli bacterium]|nr:stage II sporulation protein D [Bacilli bacterium]
MINLTDKKISINLEDYIFGVVAAEMPALFHEEALKAQAVASRSYVLSNKKNNEINITSTINDQVYLTNDELKVKWGLDYNKFSKKIKKCIKETNNLVLKREDKILKAFYFSMSNGYTENSKNVFKDAQIESKPSKWDNSEIKNFIFEKIMPEEELKTILNIKERINIQHITKNETGRVSAIKINDNLYSGIDIRQILSLRSTDFTITKKENYYIFTTKGYGHGVGMSQYGANGMAKEGYTYDEILKYYYNNVKITKI